MKFFCPHCERKIDDAVIMHYVIRHPAILEASYSDSQIEMAMRQHFFPARHSQFAEMLLTGTKMLARLLNF